MSNAREYSIQNNNAFIATLEPLLYLYADNATFQEALRQYIEEKNPDPLAKLFSPYELELSTTTVNHHGYILPARETGLKSLSLFKKVAPFTEADSSTLSPEEILKRMQFT